MSVTGNDDTYDPNADPEMIQPQRLRPQPDQAEGADDPAETGAGDVAGEEHRRDADDDHP
ncbi:hypothetical protein [Nocardia cyriacigeorgica]|jgi:hypothetical protein|uniref:hypothetical protein n=1 Tax=Nocardia cyriacigeorgica TaxID=135487 RepID=UPI00056C822B|nr:hypothetical protein [Nocardia cyriacigeorgica]AVH23640.1 hypothetical protein C5B73_21620 [Nocardia cyriacigeorgica]MBF6323249.1 hypothetical protein [Nocardia cyriacigeorgica]MBF6496752.1 hypothetical protein [Nocardia cyriacigeorgica]PPJ15135.1 hypothetical protein C5E43_06480 [Nocardia cyriacigeorgica]TLF55688.1 hypothetical protein FEK31_18950 [Nocardia cyriacigeorgica]